MKKGNVVIFLCMILLLTGCKEMGNKNNPGSMQDQRMKDVVDMTANKNVLVWKDALEYSNEKIPFSPTTYTPKVPNYHVAPQLQNIENLHRFHGFSQGQIDQLTNNGFVILEPNPQKAHYYMKMYDLYEENEYNQIPNFVTVDVALHLYHKFFDETLKSVEKEQLFQALQQLTENMLQKTIGLYSTVGNQAIKKDLADIMVYFSVGNKLINGSYGDIPEDLVSIAEKEIKQIENAQGYIKSPLFGFDINYEQFVVRGHYTGDEILESYFRTMMWYGLIGFPFYDQEGNFDYDSIAKSMLLTYIAFLEKDGVDDIALWDKIYAPTNFFVGQSDDITLFELKEVIIKVYGEDVIPEDIRNEKYRSKLIKEIEKLPGPQIQHKLVTGIDTPTEKQFRFMGQRYTLDANIMQELMFPILRPVPTGLDVVGAFGSERAETLVKEGYLEDLDPEKYVSKLETMRKKVESLEQKDWQQNLYNGWLWILRSIWTSIEEVEGLPFFMKSQAWEDKNIHTGLGSYAELKHDTVLYAKQPVAEMGGGEEWQEPYPNYVEPAVEVYDRLLWLVQYSKTNLEKRGLLLERSSLALERLEEIYELFRKCSVKELENIPISEEENKALKYIGGTMEFIDDTLSDQYKQSISSAVISDVAGIADAGAFLEIGTGLPNEILVAIHYEGKVYLARGSVYSYYEFVGDKPLTDQQWHEMLGVERVEENEWHYERINPERLLKDAPLQPQWISSFKSFDSNQVEITPVEYKVGQ